MKDYTFADGTTVPKGSILVAASHAIQKDESFYENAHQFDGFRFSNLREREGENARYLAANTSTEFLHFGHGHHAWYALNIYLLTIVLVASLPSMK